MRRDLPPQRREVGARAGLNGVTGSVREFVASEPDQLLRPLLIAAAGFLFEVEKVDEPVADRALVDPPAAFVTEQCRPLTQARSDLLEVPVDGMPLTF